MSASSRRVTVQEESYSDTTCEAAATVVHIDGAPRIRLKHEAGPGQQYRAFGQAKVWPAALALTDAALALCEDTIRSGTGVIELGCGLGLPGMVCAALGANVLLTDVPEVLPLVHQRAEENFGKTQQASDVPYTSGTVLAAALKWGSEDAQELLKGHGNWGLVLCSECVYEPLYGKSWQALADTIAVLCRSSCTRAMVSVQRRAGEFEDADDGVDKFLEALSQTLLVSRFDYNAAELELTSSAVEVYVVSSPSVAAKM